MKKVRLMFKLNKTINIFRIAVILLVVCICASANKVDAQQNVKGNSQMVLSMLKGIFAQATRVELVDTACYLVYNKDNKYIGEVFLSSPYSDKIIGYEGPTPLLIACDANKKIIKVKLLSNDETPSYIDDINDHNFLENWDGLSIKEAINKNVDAVSGATYTCDAITSSLKLRLEIAVKNGKYSQLK